MNTIRLFGFADEACPMIDGQIAAMKRNALQGLEIRGVDGESISDISLEKAREVRKKLDDAGFIVSSLGSPIGKIHIKNDDFTEHLEKLRHTMELGNILGTARIRLFSFYLPTEDNFDDYAEEVIDRVGKMADICLEYGITPCHENEKNIFGDTAKRCKKLLDALPNLKAIFDPANFVQCGVDTLDAWELLHERVCYMHIKDAMSDGFVVPAGKGDGHVPEIVAKYIKQGGTDFTLEPHLTVFAGLDALENGEKSAVDAYKYKDSDTAFDVAVKTLKEVLSAVGD